MLCFWREIILLLKPCQASEVQKIFLYYKQQQSVFWPIEHFAIAIDECEQSKKEWEPLAIV